MNNAELHYYLKRLLELKKHHSAVLSDLEQEALRPVGGEAAGILSNVPFHKADLSAVNYEEEVTIGLLENEDELLREINDALDRIEQRTFGRCENCGQKISPERLEALPYARYCMRCAREFQEKPNS